MLNDLPLFTETELSAESYQELLPDFFKEIIADFASIKLAQKQNNLQIIRQFAHKIKGSAACYNASLISEKAKITQDSIDHSSQADLIQIIDQLGDSIIQSHEYARQNFKIS